MRMKAMRRSQPTRSCKTEKLFLANHILVSMAASTAAGLIPADVNAAPHFWILIFNGGKSHLFLAGHPTAMRRVKREAHETQNLSERVKVSSQKSSTGRLGA